MIDEELNKSVDDNLVNVLWTGGWDSSYRIAELSRKSCTIQPFYVYGDERFSEQYERNAMQTILLKLNKKKNTKATILPIKYIDKKSIPLNQEITESFVEINKETQLGSQHEWLARLAYTYPGLELGTEAAPLEVSNILTAINKYGKLIKDKSSDGYILDPENSKKEGILVLGNFKFPIIKKTGNDMRENIIRWGYEDVMKNVWVCHAPIFGKACGFCHPCELKIETGMEFLMPDAALKRYAKRKKRSFRLVYKIERKSCGVIEKVMPNYFIGN